MSTLDDIASPISPDTADAGTLGIPHLKRFWARIVASRSGNYAPPLTDEELGAKHVLLAGLRLGLRETAEFLVTSVPSFAEFENWVIARNGGAIDPERLARLRAALQREGTLVLETILPKPVLSPSDLAFWDEQGYVVLRQAVSREACRAAVDAILAHADISMEQPDSWYKEGLWIPLAHHPALWANRNSPRIHTAFAQIWGRSDLWINVDVCGVNPPLRVGQQFHGTPLHWDISLAPPLRFGTQAILYLTDTAANQGAFSCVPGFHRRLEAWLKEIPSGVDPREVAIRELQAVPVAAEAGDLIIWHHALPHAATANLAALLRVAQYLNMFPGDFELSATWV